MSLKRLDVLKAKLLKEKASVKQDKKNVQQRKQYLKGLRPFSRKVKEK